jgi:hypothetical protein
MMLIYGLPKQKADELPSALTYIDSEEPNHLLRNYISYKNIQIIRKYIIINTRNN